MFNRFFGLRKGILRRFSKSTYDSTSGSNIVLNELKIMFVSDTLANHLECDLKYKLYFTDL